MPVPRPPPRYRRPEISETHEQFRDDETEDGVGLARLVRPLLTGRSGKERRRRGGRRRIVEKNGNCNIQYKNISKKRRRYIKDLYTTLVDSR